MSCNVLACRHSHVCLCCPPQRLTAARCRVGQMQLFRVGLARGHDDLEDDKLQISRVGEFADGSHGAFGTAFSSARPASSHAASRTGT